MMAKLTVNERLSKVESQLEENNKTTLGVFGGDPWHQGGCVK